MFAKLIVVCALAVVASAEYPPGVHPALCPNYPYCDMSLMARYTMEGTVPEWVYNPYIMPFAPMVTPVLKPVEPVPAAKSEKFPADFDSTKCPDYPYCKTE